MDNLGAALSAAEQHWFQPIVIYLQNAYASVHLPSHDSSHHIRVWNYCKELMHQLNEQGATLNFSPQQAIIASLFHDVGLTIDTGEFHGYQSRLLCEEFFKKNSHFSGEELQEVLFAIEHHDDKQFKGNVSQPINLTTLISTADDLDAFGLVGVFRYLEIYALREIAIENIPQKVLANLENRFANFKQNFEDIPALLSNQSRRYGIAKEFFEEMQRDFNQGIANVSESINIAKALIKSLVVNQHDIKTTVANGLVMNTNPKSIDFYVGLIDELEL